MLNLLSEAQLAALIGLGGGIALGLAARLGRLCTLGAIEDLFYAKSDLRLRMWALAIGVAMVASFVAAGAGLIDLQATLYLSRGWNPGAVVVGGLIFGYGMALAGNCGFGALARLGGGDLRSLMIVMVMGLSAYVTLNGPLAQARVALFGNPGPVDTLPSFAVTLSAISGAAVPICGILLGLAVLIASLASGRMRQSAPHLVWGSVAGLAIASGWIGTTLIARHGFDALPVVSHTFAAPLGETMLYAMTSSGNSLSFGTGSVVGVVLGAFAGCLIRGHFRWEACEDPRELGRQIAGAAMMGVGAVLALGCSVGQGMSAASLGAHSAPLAIGAMIAGAALGLRQLIEGFQPGV